MQIKFQTSTSKAKQSIKKNFMEIPVSFLINRTDRSNEAYLGIVMIVTNQEETPAATNVMHFPLYFFDMSVIVYCLIPLLLHLIHYYSPKKQNESRWICQVGKTPDRYPEAQHKVSNFQPVTFSVL